MNAPLFDPASFLRAPVDTELPTRRQPLPAEETYGQITKIDLVSGKKDDRVWAKLNVSIAISDQEFLQRAGREQATITYGLMLDVNENGALQFGADKNFRLGALRAATGTNLPGKPLEDMVGQYIRFTIGHRPDDNDPSIVYDEVRRVAKM